jgi:hypothetical protein
MSYTVNYDPSYRRKEDVGGFVWSLNSNIPDDLHRAARNYSFANVSVRALVPFSIRTSANKLAEVPFINLSLLAVSTHRDKYPVVALGRRGILGTTRGHRVVAGTIAFSILNESPFAPLIREYAAWKGNAKSATQILPDELPPFDLLVFFKDDFLPTGGATYLIEGVEILDSSRSVSTTDVTLADSYSFMARNVTELIDLTKYKDLYEAQIKPVFPVITPLALSLNTIIPVSAAAAIDIANLTISKRRAVMGGGSYTTTPDNTGSPTSLSVNGLGSSNSDSTQVSASVDVGGFTPTLPSRQTNPYMLPPEVVSGDLGGDPITNPDSGSGGLPTIDWVVATSSTV